jgi:hypothetical protein
MTERGPRSTRIGRPGCVALPGGTVVDVSLGKVRDASAYIGIIGHSYGQIPDTAANPQRLSLTELGIRQRTIVLA